ncbi:MAG: hypothetical protein IPM92_11820 [Saprospiraceae bacterium]|nr:hypothetical protein [Saprospiraceae bacterium]
MKKSIQLIFILALAFVYHACDDNLPVVEGTGSLEIAFKGEYENFYWVKGQSYDYFNRGNILFTKSEFFLSKLALYHEGLKQALSEVEYVSISEHHVSETKASEGLILRFEGIPAATYDSLAFNLGLTETQNKTKPVEYLPTHPLGEGSRYWAGWNSYIYSKTEGSYNDGTKAYNFTYHSGFDDAMKPLLFKKSILIEKDKTTKIILHVNHKLLFADSLQGMDIASNPQIHNKSTVMDAFMNRFKDAFRIE